MPLPNPPTRQSGKPGKDGGRADSDLLLKGILCALIGLGVLLSPYFISSPGMHGIVANASLVGWFALMLGCALIGLYVRRRLAGRAKP